MNDPKRLLLGEANERERALLQAAAAEEPQPGAAALFAASLGLPLPESAPPPVAEPKDGALELSRPSSERGGGKLATSKLAGEKLAGEKLAAKWLALAGAGMVAISSSWLVSKPSSERPSDAASSAQSGPRVVPVEADEKEPAPSPPLPETGSVSHSSPTSSIAAEIRALDQVRSLLRAHQSTRALRALDAYDALYTRGALREEADFMHVEALTQAERRQEARQRATRFLSTHPRSIHAARVRELAESLDAR